jgi:hypothetical protein
MCCIRMTGSRVERITIFFDTDHIASIQINARSLMCLSVATRR